MTLNKEDLEAILKLIDLELKIRDSGGKNDEDTKKLRDIQSKIREDLK